MHTNKQRPGGGGQTESASPFTRTVKKHTLSRGRFPGPASGSQRESPRSPNAAHSSSSGSGQKELQTLTFELLRRVEMAQNLILNTSQAWCALVLTRQTNHYPLSIILLRFAAHLC